MKFSTELVTFWIELLLVWNHLSLLLFCQYANNVNFFVFRLTKKLFQRYWLDLKSESGSESESESADFKIQIRIRIRIRGFVKVKSVPSLYKTVHWLFWKAFFYLDFNKLFARTCGWIEDSYTLYLYLTRTYKTYSQKPLWSGIIA